MFVEIYAGKRFTSAANELLVGKEMNVIPRMYDALLFYGIDNEVRRFAVNEVLWVYSAKQGDFVVQVFLEQEA